MLSPFDRVLSTVVHARITGPARPFLEHASRESEWFRGRPLESAPDHFVAAFDGPARAIRCATALAAAADRFNVGVRIGLHTGECTVIGGVHSGAPVALAAAIAERARPGEVLVSRTVRDIVADTGLPFEESGVLPVGGEGEYRLFRV